MTRIPSTFRPLLLAALLSAATGCSKAQKEKGEAAPGASTPAAPTASAPAKPLYAPKKPLGNPRPAGPPQIVLPGKGIGAIRFGATWKTVERHMAAPCTLRTDDHCIYVDEAIDFTMKDGVIDRIDIHLRDRPAGKGPDGKQRYYGTFNGVIRPDFMLGMHKHVLLEGVGQPTRVEKVSSPGPTGLVERHHYDGMILDYDKLENGNVVLAGIEVYPSKTATEAWLTK